MEHSIPEFKKMYLKLMKALLFHKFVKQKQYFGLGIQIVSLFL